MTLVDSNVILDVVTKDPSWLDWSLRHLEMAASRGRLAINDVVYAEVSLRLATIADVERILDQVGCQVVAMPKPALFLAGKVFQRYRAAGGTRTGVMPDFFIGAHAATAGIALLSRDARRFRTYFPDLELITPHVA